MLDKRAFFFMILFLFISFSFSYLYPDNCCAAEYAVDKGSNLFAVTAAFINASGDLYTGGGESFTAILLMPQTAHFFLKNFALGGDLLVLLTAQGDNKSTTLGVGPKIMCFIGGKDSKSYPYLTSGFYFLRNEIEYENVDFLMQGLQTGTRFKIGAGISWMIEPHLSLLAEASYNLDKLKPEEQGKSVSGNMVIVSIGLAGFTF